MKSITTFLCLILTFLISMPDSYSQFKMVDPANEWNIAYTIRFWPPSWRTYTERYKFSQDSILLDGKYYHELLSTRSDTGNINYNTGIYFRQEDKKVWIKESKSDSAILLYDFSLQLSDTFILKYTEHHPPHFIQTFIVDKIDTVTLVNGSKRNLFTLMSMNGCKMKWIEGIGTEHVGFMNFNQFCVLDGTPGILLCNKHEDSLVYQNPQEDNCFIVRTATESPEIMDLKLYPNPTKDKIFIETDYNIISVEIYNLIGQLIIFKEDCRNPIDVSYLPPGTYFISFYILNHKSLRMKFIKQ